MKKVLYLGKGWRLLLAVLCLITTTAYGDVEPNNDIGSAESLSLNTPVSGDLATNPITDEDDYYEVVLTADGILTANITLPGSLRVYLRVYNRNGVQVNATNILAESGSLSAYCLAADTYYVRVDRYDQAGDYTLEVSASTPSIPTDNEENNSLATAEGWYEEGDAMNGHLGYSGQYDTFFGTDEDDYYTIVTDHDGNVTLSATLETGLLAYVRLYDTNGAQIAASGIGENTVSTTAFCRKQDTLIARIDRYDGCGSYAASFSVSVLTYANDTEPNNTIAEIKDTYQENEIFTGHIGYTDNNNGTDQYDYYYLIAPEDGNVTFSAVMDSSGHIYTRLYQKNGAYLGGSGIETGAASITVGCLAGDTLIGMIDHYDGCGSYTATFDVSPPPLANDSEPNNSIAEINTSLTENQSVTGHIGYYDLDTGTDGFDYYYLIAPEDGNVTFTAEMDSSGRIYTRLYQKNGAYLGGSGIETGTASVTINCLAGDTLVGLIDHYDGCGSYTATFDVVPPPFANDSEPNNTIAEINTSLAENESVTGHIGYYDLDTGTDGFDYYYLIAPEDGDVTFSAVMDSSGRIYTRLYQKNGTYLGGSGIETGTVSFTAGCMAGDTLVGLIDHYDGCGSYTATFDVTPPTYANDSEPNNTLNEALPAANFETNYGHLGYYDQDSGTDGFDFYELTVAEIPFELEAKLELTGSLRAYLRLYNSVGSQITATGILPAGDHTLDATLTTPGTYYLAVDHYDGCGSYSLGDFCGAPPSVSAVVTGPSTLCPGEQTTLQATPGLSAYQWIKDGVVVGTSAQLTVDEPGQYYVLGFDANTCAGVSETLTIDGYTVPALGITADGPTAFCEGGQVVLTATGGFASYAWSNGDTGISTTVTSSGSYSVTGTTADGCTASSVATDVTVFPVPELSISADGPTEFCEGDSVTLTAVGDFVSWDWDFGETTASVTITQSGSYSVTATTADGCTSTAGPVTVTVNSGGTCTVDCFGVVGGDGVIDDCGECRHGTSDPLYNSTCTDCNGEVNGTAYFDNCGTCVGGSTGLEPCADDCFGVPGGDGVIDDCGDCRHGTSDPLYNSSCVDCNGVPNGTAYYDNCATCVGGDTGLEPCVQDCNGEYGGTAYLDNCGTCVGGGTGLEPCEDDCFGVPGGDGVIDECGDCRHGTSDPLYNSTCADCEGVPNGPAQPGTACETEGIAGTWNEDCACIPNPTGCDAFRYFLSSANGAGGSDIFEVTLDNGANTATLTLMKTVDDAVSIAYDGNADVLYLVNQNAASYRTLDVSAPDGALGTPVTKNTTATGFTGLAFGPDGRLYAASENRQRIYAHDPLTMASPAFSYAPVAGGDIAFGQNGKLYMVSNAPHKAFEIVSGSGNQFLGFVPDGASGLALMEDGNFLFAADGRKGLATGDSLANNLNMSYRFELNGGDFYPAMADLASGCTGNETPGIARLKNNEVNLASAVLRSSPNPTTGRSTVRFVTPVSEKSLLEVIDLTGRNIATLFAATATGEQVYEFRFDGSALPNGVYIYRLTTESGVKIDKFMIAR